MAQALANANPNIYNLRPGMTIRLATPYRDPYISPGFGGVGEVAETTPTGAPQTQAEMTAASFGGAGVLPGPSSYLTGGGGAPLSRSQIESAFRSAFTSAALTGVGVTTPVITTVPGLDQPAPLTTPATMATPFIGGPLAVDPGGAPGGEDEKPPRPTKPVGPGLKPPKPAPLPTQPPKPTPPKPSPYTPPYTPPSRGGGGGKPRFDEEPLPQEPTLRDMQLRAFRQMQQFDVFEWMRNLYERGSDQSRYPPVYGRGAGPAAQMSEAERILWRQRQQSRQFELQAGEYSREQNVYQMLNQGRSPQEAATPAGYPWPTAFIPKVFYGLPQEQNPFMRVMYADRMLRSGINPILISPYEMQALNLDPDTLKEAGYTPDGFGNYIAPKMEQPPRVATTRQSGSYRGAYYGRGGGRGGGGGGSYSYAPLRGGSEGLGYQPDLGSFGLVSWRMV